MQKKMSLSSDQQTLEIQAAQLERVLPAVMRHLFSTDMAQPLAELPLAQMRLCVLLQNEGRRTMSQIGDELAISVSAVTQVADRLERAQLVERLPDVGGDRRTRFLQLTAHGKLLMEARSEARLHRAASALRRLSSEQRRAVLDALEVLRDTSRAVDVGAAYDSEIMAALGNKGV